MSIIQILIIVLFTYLIIDLIFETIKYHSYISKLKVGTHLQNTKYFIDDEFDPAHTFNIVITQVGDKQVKVKFSDNSTTIMDKYILYLEKWKIINETK